MEMVFLYASLCLELCIWNSSMASITLVSLASAWSHLRGLCLMSDSPRLIHPQEVDRVVVYMDSNQDEHVIHDIWLRPIFVDSNLKPIYVMTF